MKPSFRGQCHHCGEKMWIKGETLKEMKAIRSVDVEDQIQWDCPSCNEITMFDVEEIKKAG